MMILGAFTNLAHADVILTAPEIDPASTMTAVTLLLGGLAVLRARRRSAD
jgi:uncharacterized protein (TIGR03382 family)